MWVSVLSHELAASLWRIFQFGTFPEVRLFSCSTDCMVGDAVTDSAAGGGTIIFAMSISLYCCDCQECHSEILVNLESAHRPFGDNEKMLYRVVCAHLWTLVRCAFRRPAAVRQVGNENARNRDHIVCEVVSNWPDRSLSYHLSALTSTRTISHAFAYFQLT